MPQTLFSYGITTGSVMGNTTATPGLNRPELAAMAMDVVGKYSVLEYSMAMLLLYMLGANPKPASAIFGALTGTAVQAAALRAVAQESLSKAEMITFETILKLIKGDAKERNKIAHWLWGYTDDLPNALLLAEPKGLISYSVESFSRKKGEPQRFDEVEHAKKIFVYTSQDFTKIATNIAETTEITLHFGASVKRDIDNSGALAKLNELCSSPRFQSALSHQQQHQKNNP